MIGFERRQNILRILAEKPGIRVTQLAEQLAVSEGTIRNDLTALEEEQQVRRVRGGAVLVEPEAPLPGLTQVANAEAKQRIARWAAEMVEDGSTILLDASTTVQFMIPHLREHKRLTIVTNGLETARQVARTTSHTVAAPVPRSAGGSGAAPKSFNSRSPVVACTSNSGPRHNS